MSTEATPGPLAHASHMLARSAQTYRRQEPMPGRARRALAGTALLVSAGAKLGRGPIGQAAMMRELMMLTAAIASAAIAARQSQQAAQLREVAETNLARVHARIEAGEATRLPPKKSAAPTAPTLTGDGGTATLVRDEDRARPADPPLDPELQAMVERLRAGQSAATEATRSPVPDPLEKAPDRRTSPQEADRGIGR